MDVLWAPWRSKYIETFKDEEKKKGESCFFCDAGKFLGKEKELLVIARRKYCFAMLNRFPYNNGHAMIAPYRHVGKMNALTDDELTEMIFTVRETSRVLEEVYNPQGFNIGANLGRTAGAGAPGHLHFHIVPRWNGDTSFMTVFAEANVVSQSLTETQRILSDVFLKLFPETD